MIAFSWNKPGNNVSIISPFNNYKAIPLTPGFIGIFFSISIETEKMAIVGVPAGKIYYRFIVDGTEQYDPEKPCELFDSKCVSRYRQAV